MAKQPNKDRITTPPKGNDVSHIVSTRIISGCSDCPMCDMNDMCSGYSCRLKEHPDNFIKESKKYQPITPKWCPIKQNDVLLKYG